MSWIFPALGMMCTKLHQCEIKVILPFLIMSFSRGVFAASYSFFLQKGLFLYFSLIMGTEGPMHRRRETEIKPMIQHMKFHAT